jgi:hypothetical protein
VHHGFHPGDPDQLERLRLEGGRWKVHADEREPSIQFVKTGLKQHEDVRNKFVL